MNNSTKINMPLIKVSQISTTTNEGRILFKDLNMNLSNEHVALIGRNGVGKSTLLEIFSHITRPDQGKVLLRTKPYFVCQTVNQHSYSRDVGSTLYWFENTSYSQKFLAAEFSAAGLRPLRQLLREQALSHGELRKLKLLRGKLTQPDLLILDEPTQDLDEMGIMWLRTWLSQWQGCLMVASHDSRLLQDFKHFFIVAETGCHCFSGTFEALKKKLEQEYIATQMHYIRNLNRMVEREEHTVHIARRRARKKQYGRISELGRATPRIRLNQKRDYAQVKHGRLKKTREARLSAIRNWTKSTRRALQVNLPFILPVPKLSPEVNHPLITIKSVSVTVKGRCLFQQLNLIQRRKRLAVVGPNGSGKTTLLEIMLGRRLPSSGIVKTDYLRIGSIAQGGTDWEIEETLLSYLKTHIPDSSLENLTELLISHKFPFALSQRPMRSLSPGERVRAALICLYHHTPAVELLVLDEPTHNLDLVGQQTLTNALKVWPGGLVIASHNMNFLSIIGIDEYLELG